MPRDALTVGVIAALLAASAPAAQAQAIAFSQQAEVRQRVADTWLTVRYSRPVARGRTLFGGVVRWGRTWNPGADTATSLSVTTPIRIEGRPLPAGGYSIWMVPDSTGPWTVILSRAHPVLHTPYPGEAHDQLRLRVSPVSGAHMEALAWYFPLVNGPEATLALHWGTTIVPLRVEVTP